MFRNYLLIALRNLLGHRLIGFINIAGLSIGMASAVLILLFVWHEWSHDRFHEHADRIYRLATISEQEGETRKMASTPLPMVEALAEMPELQAMAQVHARGSVIVRRGDRVFREDPMGSADGGLFEVFDFELLRGDPATALEDPFTVVISEEVAARYFGEEDPIGGTLVIQDEDHTVTGILARVPARSHLHFGLLVSASTARAQFGPLAAQLMRQWTYSTPIYVLLAEGVARATFEARLGELVTALRPENEDPLIVMQALPLTDLYLRAGHVPGIERRGDLATLYAFGTIALLILLIACINYMNLSTARQSLRAREVGVRKVVGARRRQLMGQFFGESLVVSACAAALAGLLIVAALPGFGQLVERELSLEVIGAGTIVAVLAGAALVVGVLAGTYPALFLSGLRPMQMLRGTAAVVGHAGLRKGLVVTQFVLCIALITGAWTVDAQNRFMRGKDPGFEREHMVSIHLNDRSFMPQYEAFKEELVRHSGVLGAAGSFTAPGDWLPETPSRPEGAPGREQRPIHWLGVDHDFIDVFGLEVIQGRSFSPDHPTDAQEGILVNETAARIFGWNEPLGRRIRMQLHDREGAVIGVVRDFHYASMRDPIEAMMLLIHHSALFGRVSVRIDPAQTGAALAHLRSTWEAFSDWPFEYSFLDEELAVLYDDEARLAQTIGFFALLAILIACLGLFGLAAFTVEARTREIGIRKVLGASIGSVLTLLSKDFARLVLVAFVVAAPIGYVVMNRWLGQFAFRIELSWWMMASAGGLALAVALLTVAYHALRAAAADPVRAIRAE